MGTTSAGNRSSMRNNNGLSYITPGVVATPQRQANLNGSITSFDMTEMSYIQACNKIMNFEDLQVPAEKRGPMTYTPKITGTGKKSPGQRRPSNLKQVKKYKEYVNGTKYIKNKNKFDW